MSTHFRTIYQEAQALKDADPQTIVDALEHDVYMSPGVGKRQSSYTELADALLWHVETHGPGPAKNLAGHALKTGHPLTADQAWTVASAFLLIAEEVGPSEGIAPPRRQPGDVEDEFGCTPAEHAWNKARDQRLAKY